MSGHTSVSSQEDLCTMTKRPQSTILKFNQGITYYSTSQNEPRGQSGLMGLFHPRQPKGIWLGNRVAGLNRFFNVHQNLQITKYVIKFLLKAFSRTQNTKHFKMCIVDF